MTHIFIVSTDQYLSGYQTSAKSLSYSSYTTEFLHKKKKKKLLRDSQFDFRPNLTTERPIHQF